MNSEIIKKEFKSFYCVYYLDLVDLVIPIADKKDPEFTKSLSIESL
ncbi:MAG: hypothetical protein ACFE8E_08935 [Candidatus Hodarchaeota archaeon]